MKLVNTHKLLFSILFVLNLSLLQAQEVWTLQQCIDSAEMYNKKLQISNLDVKSSLQQERVVKGNRIPKLNLNADYKYFTDLPYQLMPMSVFGGPEGQFKEAQFGVPHHLNADLTLAIPIYNPELYGNIKTTKVATELTRIQNLKSKEEVFFEVSTVYYNAQILAQSLDFIDSNIINAKQLLKNVELLQSQELLTGTDVNRARLKLMQLEKERESAFTKYENVMNVLKFLMGKSLQAEIEIDKTINFQKIENYETGTSLSVQLAESRNELLQTQINTLQKTRFLPSLNAFASYGTTGYGYDQEPNRFLNFYPKGLAGIQLTMPLFNGMVSKREVVKKQLEIDASKLQIQMSQDQTDLNIENALKEKNNANQNKELVEKQLELAESIYSQTVLQHKEGIVPLSDVIMAETEVNKAQMEYLATIIEYLKADLKLKKESGNLLK
ncbi:TolC family protein [Brumimicrobium salinarum]|uniref:TolC family protein n=1 Tax=Brumimicrobium salinarum TaxID=2058658 RepID=A0A2I0R6S0_9FLAO|nr:TolC family protein [Brumimicrobium salinarum]PKR82265.1 TolC family protein [Brumimicrobium salinarum]